MEQPRPFEVPGTHFVSFDDAAVRERSTESHSGVSATASPLFREFFGRSDELLPGPQGFLVEVVPPHTSVGAHFHSTNQYQLFFPSKGAWYQRHEIDSVLLHYADAYATYGPFGTNSNPMSFYTLRPEASTVTGYMPGARDDRPYRGRRNLHVAIGSRLGRTLAAGESHIEELIQPHPDGLAGYLVSAGPSGAETPPPSIVAGQYLVVVSGSVEHNGRWIVNRSLGWTAPGAPPPCLRAAPNEGFEVLALHLPTPEWTMRS